MQIATWNINSIRVRLDRLRDWLTRSQVDVLCLQETKVTDDAFPFEALAEWGYHVAAHGEKSYNGVALVSKTPIEDVERGMGDATLDAQARLIAGTVSGVRVMSCYVPNGTAMDHPRAAYKLAWLSGVKAMLAARHTVDDPLVLAGDFNIAPRDVDIAEPKKWHKTVLAHPTMRQAFAELQAFGLVDVFAAHHPEGGRYSWWDYRSDAYARGRGGLRIDGLLATPGVSGRATGADIDHAERGRERPSDHVPVRMTLVDG